MKIRAQETLTNFLVKGFEHHVKGKQATEIMSRNKALYSNCILMHVRCLLFRNIRLLFCLYVLFTASLGFSQVVFIDVTDESGLGFYYGKTFGSSWGDINDDGFLDIFTSSHVNQATLISAFERPYIFLNMGSSIFSDSAYSINWESANDLHGGIFFDYDNDGDQDLLVVAGGSSSNLFFINDGTLDFALTNYAASLNISQLNGRGRLAGCLDINKDGIVDIVLNNQENTISGLSPSLFTRVVGSAFEESNLQYNFNITQSDFSTLQDLNNDGQAELVVSNDGAVVLYDISLGQLNLIGSHSFPKIQDIAIGDLTGNLLPDIYIARNGLPSEVTQFAPNEIRSVLITNVNYPVYEFSFLVTDTFSFSIIPRNPSQYNGVVFLGNNGPFENTALDPAEVLNLKFSPTDSIFDGNSQLNSSQAGWQFLLHRDSTGRFTARIASYLSSTQVAITFKSLGEFIDLQKQEIPYPMLQTEDKLLLNQGNFQFSVAPESVSQGLFYSRSVVMADFDNDMDLDLYIVTGGLAKNYPNLLLENTGSGEFVLHNDAWGALGSSAGIGESVTVSDIDNDGFLDLLVSNGLSIYYLEDAPYNLYRNMGNENNWLKLELRGTISTSAAYGAVVYAYAGGKAQVRTQNAGEHSRCQNDSRIHFGLAQNVIVDSLVIYWPGGATKKLYNLPVNEILKVYEPGGYSLNFNIVFEQNEEYYYVLCNDENVKRLRISAANGEIVSIQDVSFIATGSKVLLTTSNVPGFYFVDLLNIEGAILGRKRIKVI